jgi:hypothetical protein
MQQEPRAANLWYLREAHGRHAAIRERLRSHFLGSRPVPKRNYGYEKRQKELNKQRKQEEKRQRKLNRSGTPPDDVKVDETPSLDRAPEE